MRNALALITVAIALAACSPPSARQLSAPVLPPELADCKFYEIGLGGVEGNVRVVRCLNSATTSSYKSGKATMTTVVIVGITYAAVTTEGK